MGRRRGENLDIRSNLLLRWRLLDTSGDSLDSSGNGFDGTVSGAIQSATGVTLDGVNDEITNVESGLLTPLTDISVFTIFLRAKSSVFAVDKAAFSFGQSNNNDAFAMYPYESSSGNGLQIWYDGTVIISGAGTAPADNTNHDFVFRQTSPTASEVFVDGVSEATSAVSKATAVTMNDFTLGRFVGNGEWFAGGASELIIWNRGLTNDQIKLLSNR